MIVDKKTLLLFRIVSGVIVLVGVLLAFLVSKTLGGLIIALGLFFFFAPHKEGDIL